MQDYIKKLERERLESDLQEAQDTLVHMGSRLNVLGKDEGSEPRL